MGDRPSLEELGDPGFGIVDAFQNAGQNDRLPEDIARQMLMGSVNYLAEHADRDEAEVLLVVNSDTNATALYTSNPLFLSGLSMILEAAHQQGMSVVVEDLAEPEEDTETDA
jgi:hypothetical protein